MLVIATRVLCPRYYFSVDLLRLGKLALNIFLSWSLRQALGYLLLLKNVLKTNCAVNFQDYASHSSYNYICLGYTRSQRDALIVIYWLYCGEFTQNVLR